SISDKDPLDSGNGARPPVLSGLQDHWVAVLEEVHVGVRGGTRYQCDGSDFIPRAAFAGRTAASGDDRGNYTGEHRPYPYRPHAGPPYAGGVHSRMQGEPKSTLNRAYVPRTARFAPCPAPPTGHKPLADPARATTRLRARRCAGRYTTDDLARSRNLFPFLVCPVLLAGANSLASGHRVKGLREATARGAALDAVAASWTIGSAEDGRERYRAGCRESPPDLSSPPDVA